MLSDMRWCLVGLMLVGACAETITAPVPRVAAWGDSITFGYGASADSSYPADLTRLLGRTVYNGGVNSETSSDILLRIAHDSLHRADVTILWMGRNNPQHPDVVLADVAAAVTLLGANDRYLVLSVLTRSWEVPGTPEYAGILALNAELQRRYGSHYVEMRGYLVSQYNPAIPLDTLSHANDAVPWSLRSDEIHPNEHGYALIAAKVAAEISSRGW